MLLKVWIIKYWLKWALKLNSYPLERLKKALKGKRLNIFEKEQRFCWFFGGKL